MDVGVLGSLRVRVNGAWTTILARRQRLVFGVLLAHADTVVDGERLLHEVWAGTPPASGLQSLRYHVSQLRDALAPSRPRGDPGLIETVGSGYRLLVDPAAIDAGRFEDLADRGARLVVGQHWNHAVATLDSAMGLWRGDAWQDFRYDDFAQTEIHRLEAGRVTCLEDRIAARLGRGEDADLVPELRELTAQHPMHEPFWGQAMIALSRAGRPAEAEETWRRACAVLDRELGVAPDPALARLRERIRDPSSPATGGRWSSRAGSLPSRTSTFIGRRRDRAAVRDLLDRRRLVTVVGPGGVGKTSLALEVARQHDSAPARAVLAELATVTRAEDVAVELVRAIRVPRMGGRPTLVDAVDHLGDRPRLLVIDNCEHLTAAVARAARVLLTGCSGLRILATSRRPLHANGEHVHVLEPMGLPTSEDDGRVERADVVRLFADRAAAARGHFEVTPENRDLVVQVCQRLDGLPLALELAAARLRHLAIDELHELLHRPLEVLVGGDPTEPRHATLRATLQWSHDLLPETAAVLLRRLAVFAGTFDLPGVAAVCTDVELREAEVVDALAALVDSSMVRRGVGDEHPMTMLQTVREFAAEQLDGAGEAESLRERHAQCFAARVVRQGAFGSAAHLKEARQLRVDADNHAAALAWSLRRRRHDLVLPLVAGAAHYWYAAPGGNRELQWLVGAIDDLSIAPTPEYASALCTLGLSLPWMGRTREAEAVATVLGHVVDVLATPEHLADLCWVQAALATVTGQVRESRALFAQAVELLRECDHPKLSVFLYDLAWREIEAGDRPRAAILIEELDDVGRRRSQPLGKARVRLLRGWLAHHRGDQHAALAATEDALAEIRRMRLVGPQLDPLRAICRVAATAGAWDRARASATALRRLVASNGEIAARPFADAALALVSLREGEPATAARHVADGLELMQRTGTSAGLDDILVAGTQVLAAMGHHDRASDWHAVRAARCRRTGLVDAAPIARLAARTMAASNRTPAPPAAGAADQTTVGWALDTVAA